MNGKHEFTESDVDVIFSNEDHNAKVDYNILFDTDLSLKLFVNLSFIGHGRFIS